MSTSCSHPGRLCPANCDCSCPCESCTVAVVKEHVVKPAVKDYRAATKEAARALAATDTNKGKKRKGK